MTIPLPDVRELSGEVLGGARETVCRWWSAYAGHGVQALPHCRTGRPLSSTDHPQPADGLPPNEGNCR
jgi:hypothetical protein